jgi:hypothetical protein
MLIIGISGLAGSGKDTCADILVEDHGFVKVSFADPLKRICRDVFDFSDEQLWGSSELRNAPDERFPRSRHTWEGLTCVCCGAAAEQNSQCYLTPRYALRTLGSEWGRDCYNSIWVEYALRTACTTPLPSLKGGVVIPDVRFKNELKALRAADAMLIRVVHPSMTSVFGAQHSSEFEQTTIPDSAFDEVIVNDRGISDLKDVLAEIAARFTPSK